MDSTIEELTALDDLGVSRHMVQNKFFAKWKPNITVSVWGRGHDGLGRCVGKG